MNSFFNVAGFVAGAAFDILTSPSPAEEKRCRRVEAQERRAEDRRWKEAAKRREESERLHKQKQKKQQEARQRKLEEKCALTSGIYEVDNMTGKEFENLLAVYFEKIGYQIKSTAASHDYGADLILSKHGSKTIIQSKRSKNSVSVRAVQEVASAVRHYKADKGIVITNNSFTKNACILALSNEVELWDRKKLIEFMNRVKEKDLA